MSDRKLVRWLLLLLVLPLVLAIFSGDRFRYPCQDPENWDKAMCKPPICEVTRTCPEQIFEGTNSKGLNYETSGKIIPQVTAPVQGVNCAK